MISFLRTVVGVAMAIFAGWIFLCIVGVAWFYVAIHLIKSHFGY